MSKRSLFHALTITVVVASSATSAVGAQTAQSSITGRVTDATSGQPVASAQVSIVGTSVGAMTNNEGRYVLRAVVPGQLEVRVLRIGFAEERQRIAVAAGQTVTLDFRMRAVAMSLNPIVTTATGLQRRVEVGNAIAQVNATEIVESRAVSNVADLMTSRAAGVQVIPGTQTGAGTRVRIRGTSSLSLTNNPIYVIDGIRVEGSTGSSTVSVGGTTPSRVGDLNPEEIQSIEVVRGPSAATLYGTDAANGVIVITTKRGTAGRLQWNHYTEQTALKDNNDYPDAFWGWRNGSTRSNTTQCFLSQVVAGACVQDSVTSYNLHDDPEATPYGIGYRRQYGSQLSGGSESVRFFLHGEFEDEDGVTKVPDFEKRYLAARDVSFQLRPEEKSPNRLTRISSRANVNMTLPRNAELAVSVGFTSQDLRLPRSDDSGVSGIAANTYGGPGFKYNLTSTGDTLYGWRQFTPRSIYQGTTTQSVERLISSANANWRPSEWLALRGNVGVDFTSRLDSQICRFANCPDVGEDRLGFKTDNRTSFFVYTVDAGATASRTINSSIESKTTAGVQFYRNILDRNGATGKRLAPGSTTVTSGAIKEADETTSESRTLGGYIEQSLAFNDRLFVTGAVRSDRNSAFGANFKTVFYPKLSVSWVISDESFFPAPSWLSQLRLRSAYGASGVQPGTIDAVQYYSPSLARTESGEATGVVFSAVGNRNLKPERSTEIEFGIDGTFGNGRISTEFTYYNKKSEDALISRILPPSLGTGLTSRFENLGEVRNSGFEALVNAQILTSDRLAWDITLNGSTNDNELVSLGSVPPIIGTTQHQKPGYPLYGWWSRALKSWEDKDGNGIISYNANPAVSEIVVSDTSEFHGYPLPKVELAVTNGFDFWQRRLRLAAMIDYKGGHKIYNNTERIRCASRLNCEGLISPDASFFEQARTVMVREHPSRSVAGFFEDGDFLRFRELSLTFTPPPAWAGKLFRGRSLVASLAARNLGILWTDYTGVDPEAFGTTGDAPSEFQAFAPPTYYSLRFTIGF